MATASSFAEAAKLAADARGMKPKLFKPPDGAKRMPVLEAVHAATRKIGTAVKRPVRRLN